MLQIKQSLGFLKPLVPITSIGLFAQAMAAWIAPRSEIGHEFLGSIEVLFTTEFVMMHSAVFFEGRRVIKSKWGQYLAAGFLFFVYGLFIINLIPKNPWIGYNYVAITVTRLLYSQNPIVDTEFYKALDKDAQKMVPAMLALLKAGAVFFLIPIAVFSLPLPHLGLTPEVITELFPSYNVPKDTITFVQAFALYFFIMAALDVRKTVKMFTQKRVSKPQNYSNAA